MLKIELHTIIVEIEIEELFQTFRKFIDAKFRVIESRI
jgi:hypothetical protein